MVAIFFQPQCVNHSKTIAYAWMIMLYTSRMSEGICEKFKTNNAKPLLFRTNANFLLIVEKIINIHIFWFNKKCLALLHAAVTIGVQESMSQLVEMLILCGGDVVQESMSHLVQMLILCDGDVVQEAIRQTFVSCDMS